MYVSQIFHWRQPIGHILLVQEFRFLKKQNGTISLYIEGKIRTRSWVDQSNITRYTTEIYADNMELLGRKNEQIGVSQVSQIDNPVQPSLTSPVQGSNVDSGNNDIDDLPF